MTDSVTKFYCWKSSSFAEYWQNIITWGKCYFIQEIFRRSLVVFLQSWIFCNLVRCLQIFVQIILQRNFCCKNFFYRKLACFAFLAFYYNFLFNIFLLQVCANVCKLCAKFLCDYVQKLFLQNIWHSFILHFSPFLFSCYCEIVLQVPDILRFIFLKGLWN